jgi:hypothetical protein
MAGPGHLTVRWRVRGPAKDLEIVSHYRRTDASA